MSISLSYPLGAARHREYSEFLDLVHRRVHGLFPGLVVSNPLPETRGPPYLLAEN